MADIARHADTYRDFWALFLQRGEQIILLHKRVSPSSNHLFQTKRGDIEWNYVVARQRVCAEMYIASVSDRAANEHMFDRLFDQRSSIETVFGGPLKWDRRDKDGAVGCRISAPVEAGSFEDRGRWPQLQRALADAMARLHAALWDRVEPHCRKAR